MQALFNSFVTTKIHNADFARAILALRRDLEDELDNASRYKEIGVWTTDDLMRKTGVIIEKYNNKFISLFETLEFYDKVQLIASWKEFKDLAESHQFIDSDILLSAASIVR